VLDVIPAHRVRDLEHEGLALIALAAADIKREPRFNNARLVWSYRLAPVGIPMRLAVLRILADDGPMALSPLQR
jgi:hypothetical protein